MTSKRLFFALLAAVILLSIGLVAGTYGANKLLASQANTLTNTKAKAQALAIEQSNLSKAQQDIFKYRELDAIAQAVVPQDKNQAEAVREITNIAAANGVSLASISFPASTLGTSSSGSTGVATKAPSAKSAALSQLTQVKNIPGVYQLPITVQSDTNSPVSFNNFISFLSALEHNRRTAQVTSIAIQPQTTGKQSTISFNLTLNEYIKP